MRPEVLESHMVPMRDGPLTEHGTLEPCRHSVACEEAQDEGAFRGLSAFEPGERLRTAAPRLMVADELRLARVHRLARTPDSEFGGSVSVGLARPPSLGEVEARPASMRSADAWHRQSSGKLARQMEYGFGRRWGKTSRPGGARRSAVVNQAELDAVLAELGIDL